ncbi:MAG: hypothetical protein AAF184_23645 [Pseudomonadota bacterium]
MPCHRIRANADRRARGVAGGVLIALCVLCLPAVGAEDPLEPTPPSQAQGVQTQLVVRARARGANYVTTDMGVKVTLKDMATGAVLAEGLTIGNVAGTDPELTAAFRTTLALTGPTRIEASVRAPLSYPHASVSVSSTAWVLPGKHITGEGWVLELPGFVVTLLDAPRAVALGEDGEQGMEVLAKVVMMCGCPTEPGGRWDSDGYELKAALVQSGVTVREATFSYAGEKSTYRTRLPVPDAAGHYELVVTAYDPVTGNVGVTSAPVDVH